MEITEGNVRVYDRQHVSIGDERLEDLFSSGSPIARLKIEKELIYLARKVMEQREDIIILERELEARRNAN